MVWLLPASVVTGLVLGLRIRLPLFVMLLLLVCGVVAACDLVHGRQTLLFDLTATWLGLQSGYVGGLALRALLSRIVERSHTATGNQEFGYPRRCEP